MYRNLASQKLPIGTQVTLLPPLANPERPGDVWVVEALYGAQYPHDAVVSLKEVSHSMAFRVCRDVRWFQVKGVAA